MNFRFGVGDADPVLIKLNVMNYWPRDCSNLRRRERLMPTGIEVMVVSVVVIYVVILVFGIRAAFETYTENRTFSKWVSRVSSANPAGAKGKRWHADRASSYLRVG